MGGFGVGGTGVVGGTDVSGGGTDDGTCGVISGVDGVDGATGFEKGRFSCLVIGLPVVATFNRLLICLATLVRLVVSSVSCPAFGRVDAVSSSPS